MTDAPALTQKALQALRRRGGVLSSTELQALLGVSQPTVSRALAPLIRSGQVQKVGAARSQRYVLPRAVPGVGREVAVMGVDEAGRATPFARMVPLEGGAFWVDEADGVSMLHGGLPWFLDDMRPQGFMGRTFAHAHPARARDPGRLGGGLRAHGRPGHAGHAPGRHVIVKFSPAGDALVDQRVRDLLACEHLALQTLAQAGLPASRTQLLTRARCNPRLLPCPRGRRPRRWQLRAGGRLPVMRASRTAFAPSSPKIQAKLTCSPRIY